MNTGYMPGTDFRYEEFEGLLASFFLTLLPLKKGAPQDFDIVAAILNGFAERHGVQKPEEAVVRPRQTQEEWGQPEAFGSCWSLLDMLNSFVRDFGVGHEQHTIDANERCRLARVLLGVLHRHGALKARFEEIEGHWMPVAVEEWNIEKRFRPLPEILS